MKRVWIVALVLLAVGLVLPKVVYPVVAIQLVCFGLFAVALDLLFGFAGLLSFGHALFWGGAGYTASILIARAHVDGGIAVIAGMLYAVVLALVVGLIAIRRTGIYFAMITLAIGQIQYFTAFQLVGLTGGENGLQLPNGRGTFFGLPVDNDIVFYYLVLGLVSLGIVFALRVVGSPFGAVLRAMRENEPRAISLGYRVERYKLATFVLSGALAGFAGGLYAMGNRLAGLDMVDWHTSGKVVMMTVLGGIGTIVGPVVGAGIFESLDYFVSKTPIGEETNIVMGTIFGLCVLLFRRGIIGELLHVRPRRDTPETTAVTSADQAA